MTEAEWHGLDDLDWKLLYLPDGRLSERKKRLFAVACCHRIVHLVPGDSLFRLIEAAEQCAEGLLPIDVLRVLWERNVATDNARRMSQQPLPDSAGGVALIIRDRVAFAFL